MVTPNDINTFWFDGKVDELIFPAHMAAKWFTKDENFDELIREKFEDTLWAATRGELDHWLETDEGTLAFIVLLDQFSRNLYRDLPEEYSQDEQVLAIALKSIDEGVDKRLPPVCRVFIYLPLEHSEDLELQERSVHLFEKLLEDSPKEMASFAALAYDYAKKHRDMIKQWGRFPYRNEQLGRETTPAEKEFLKQPNSRF